MKLVDKLASFMGYLLSLMLGYMFTMIFTLWFLTGYHQAQEELPFFADAPQSPRGVTTICY